MAYFEVVPQFRQCDVTTVGRVDGAEPIDVDVDLILGEVDGDVLLVMLQIEAHL